MRMFQRSRVLPHPEDSHPDHAGAGTAFVRARLPLRPYDIKAYHACEDLTEAIIYLMVIFSPWAFGTTQEWSKWVMNGSGYALGLLLAVKLTIRGLKGYCPGRWGPEAG